MKKFILFITFSFIFIVSAIFVGTKWLDNNSKVIEGDISVYEGASVKQVADILEVNGNIKSSNTFYFYIKSKQILNKINIFTNRPFDVSFKAGDFIIEDGDFDTLIHTLNEIRNIDDTKYSKVTFPEGIDIEKFGAILDKENVTPKEEFYNKVNDEKYYNDLKENFLWLPDFNKDKIHQLEGFLQANTYEFKEGSSPEDVIEKLLQGTNEWYKKYKVDMIEKKLDFNDLIILSSIIERESKHSKDRPKVSRVFHNRLNENMPLQSDITATYALREHKTFVTYEDINVDSPYNTYKNEGLPIGPISAPSEESFEAALYPENDFDYLYFYARPNGDTFYSNNLDEHQKYIDKYEQEWLDL